MKLPSPATPSGAFLRLVLCLALLVPPQTLRAQTGPAAPSAATASSSAAPTAAEDAPEDDSFLDGLFDEPADDILVDGGAEGAAAEIDHTQAYTAPQSLALAGSFSSEGGLGLGWTAWPDPSDPLKNYDGTMGAQASSSLSLSARASEHLQVAGSVSVSMTPLGGSYAWSGISVGQIYADYYGIPNVFIRLGQHSFSWGQGRLFAPGNLMVDSGNGAALRAAFPTVLSGVSVVALAQNGFFAKPASPSYKEPAYGILADHVVGNTRISLGLRHREAEGLRMLLSLKRVMFKTDFLFDGVYRYKELGDVKSYALLAGFYREWTDFKVYGEYNYESSTLGGGDHNLGLAAGLNNLFGSSIDGGVKWMHAFQDGSGSVALGLDWDPLPHLNLKAAVPVAYGAEGSRYVINNGDPAKRRIALILLATISGSY